MDATLLGRFELFEGLSPGYLQAIAPAFGEERHETGVRIFSEGDPGDKLYLIGSGAIRISQRLGTTGEEALAVLKEGDYFGDMSLIDARPRSADAIVDDACLLYTLDRSVFLTLLKTDAELTINVLFRFIHTLTRRLRVNNERIRALNLMSMW